MAATPQPLSAAEPAGQQRRDTPERMSGARAGVIVLIGIACANVGNYLFQLIAARWLGPRPYGDLAALIALAALITLPLGGIQAAVAREVATLEARTATLLQPFESDTHCASRSSSARLPRACLQSPLA